VPSPLSPEAREATLEALPRAELDLLVVGGGITGAGVARDAALRGLSVALVEAVDFAAGTSSRSSKLIHGGVRYLQQGDVALVREAATERRVLREIAPHSTIPALMVLPTYRRATQMKLAAGLWTFEKLAGVEENDRHRMWSAAEAVENEPCIDPEGLYGAATYTEYLTDDARLVLDNVAGACEAGAHCVNHARVENVDAGGATISDALTDRSIRVRARVVVNAAGPWVDAVRRERTVDGDRRLQLTKGVHLVVDHARLPLRHVVVMNARDKRPVFAVPRDGTTYIGTTDTTYDQPTLYPAVTAEDADYLLEAANRTFGGRPLERSDIQAAWAGLRPLLAEEGKRPSEISRRDEILADPSTGLLSIAGGKLTAYRKMAERVVDRVEEALGRRPTPPSTATTPLPGGRATTLDAATVAGRLRTSAAIAERLLRFHGAGVAVLLERAERSPGSAAPLPGLGGILRVEIEHALDAEMALTLQDVLERRTRALLFDPRQGLDGVEAAATIAAARLGWDATRTAREIAEYQRLATSLRSFP